jgi:hypothetical protein
MSDDIGDLRGEAEVAAHHAQLELEEGRTAAQRLGLAEVLDSYDSDRLAEAEADLRLLTRAVSARRTLLGAEQILSGEPE